MLLFKLLQPVILFIPYLRPPFFDTATKAEDRQVVRNLLFNVKQFRRKCINMEELKNATHSIKYQITETSFRDRCQISLLILSEFQPIN